MDANSGPSLVEVVESVTGFVAGAMWDTTAVEATARDLLDVGLWAAAEYAVQEGGRQEMGSKQTQDRKNSSQDSRNIPGCPIAEAQYQAARACLERAQKERTEATCRFLAARAQWQASMASMAVWEPNNALGSSGGNLPPLEAAESELRRAKFLYCAALEHNQLMQHLLKHTRFVFQQAQEHLEQLAMAD